MPKPRIASWLILDALQTSREKIEDYSIQDAHSEIIDLEDAVTAYNVLNGNPSEYAHMTSLIDDLKITLKEMKKAREEKFESNGLGAAFQEGFELRIIGSVHQLVKAIPDIEGGHYVIDIGGGIDNTAKASTVDWGVTANIRNNRFNNYTTVYEKLTLTDALAKYKELPLPLGEGLVQTIFDTWDDVSTASAKPGL